ncbi:Uncharacterised protein [Klebsiella pneumoniae]|nr:Uncharacterised protein [Klebsiella pneumoniae]
MTVISALPKCLIKIKGIFFFYKLIIFSHEQIMLNMILIYKIIWHHFFIRNTLIKSIFGKRITFIIKMIRTCQTKNCFNIT